MPSRKINKVLQKIITIIITQNFRLILRNSKNSVQKMVISLHVKGEIVRYSNQHLLGNSAKSSIHHLHLLGNDNNNQKCCISLILKISIQVRLSASKNIKLFKGIVSALDLVVLSMKLRMIDLSKKKQLPLRVANKIWIWWSQEKRKGREYWTSRRLRANITI